MRTRLVLMVWVMVWAPTLAHAQTTGQTTTVRDSGTGALVPNIGDDTNDSMRVTIVSGGGSGGTSSNFGSALPSAGTAAGFSDGTNMQAARVFDLDTGGGTQYGLGVNLVRRASGGSAELIGSSTSANSLPVVVASDQGAIPVSQSGTWNVTNISGTVSLPTGAATLAEQQTQSTALQLIDNPILVDDAAFTPSTSSVTMAGFEFDDTTPDSVNEGDAGAARMSANRNVYTTLRDAAGNERGANINASNELAVNASQSGTWTVQPGNTANTTAWLVTGTGGTFPATQSGTWNIGTVTTLTSITNAVQTKPIDGCGTTNYTANGAVASSGGDITTTTTCVDQISIANYHATNSTTVTVKDRAGTPIELLNSVTILPGQTVTIPLFGQTFTSGINAIAGAATTLRYWIKGRQ